MSKLFTKEILDDFRNTGYQGDKESSQIKIICKLFCPVHNFRWYLYELEEQDGIFWCFVNLNDDQCAELGSVSRAELENYRSQWGLPLEIDEHFPTGKITLQQVIDSRGTL